MLNKFEEEYEEKVLNYTTPPILQNTQIYLFEISFVSRILFLKLCTTR